MNFPSNSQTNFPYRKYQQAINLRTESIPLLSQMIQADTKNPPSERIHCSTTYTNQLRLSTSTLFHGPIHVSSLSP